MGYRDVECRLYLRLVKHAISRSFDRAGELVAVARLYVALGVTCKFCYLHSEDIQTEYAFVGVVVHSAVALIQAVLHDLEYNLGKVAGVCRRAALVEHHFQFWLRGGQV